MTDIADPKVIREKCGEPAKGQKCDWLSNNSAGAGAYVVEEFKPNDRVVLVKNPNYWKGWSGKHLEPIVLETIPEERRGSCGSRRSTPTSRGRHDQLADLEQWIKDQKLPLFVTKTDKKGQPLLSLSTQWINLNNRMLPTSDINVRRALAHSFNYDLYIQKVMKGYAVRMTGCTRRASPGTSPTIPSGPTT